MRRAQHEAQAGEAEEQAEAVEKSMTSEEHDSFHRWQWTASTSLGMGSVLAMILSFHANQSALWAIAHGICSWCYVLYYCIWGAGATP